MRAIPVYGRPRQRLLRGGWVVCPVQRLGLGSYLEGVEADVEEATKISREKKVRVHRRKLVTSDDRIVLYLDYDV